MDDHAITRLLADQAGVISRSQLLACGARPHDLKRWQRRRDLVPLLPGVYVDHTGDPTWLQRAWAGVLACEPAALAGTSAIRAVVGPGWRAHDDRGPILLAVTRSRKLVAPAGYRLQRLTGFETRVQWRAGPPRLRLEDAVLQVASSQATEWRTIGILTDACGTRRTTAGRLLAASEALPRLPGRRFIRAVLRDLGSGACSVLEQGYLRRVERPHGLPMAGRQVSVRSDRGREYRDVEYAPWVTLVELDGRIYHSSSVQRDLDLDRDLDAAVAGVLAVRLGWGQVFDRPCRTAVKVGALLTARGWTGSLRPCGEGCAVI